MRRNAGLTLIEVVVALLVGGLVVLVAHQVFDAVGEQGRALAKARRALDREANAHRWLGATFLSLEVGLDSAGGFEGRAHRAAFTGWQLTAEGWFERRRVVLEREDHRLVARVTPGEPLTLDEGVGDVAFDYLLDPGAESRWVREWVSPVSAPVAVRMRVAKAGCGMRDAACAVDTLLFLIRERG